MEPRLVTGPGVWPGCFVDRQSVVDVVPIIWCGVGRIDAERLDSIDQLQHPFNLRPTRQSQQTFAARRDPGDGRIALARRRRAQNIDAGKDCSKVVGRPTHECENAAGSERKDASISIQDVFLNGTTKPNPVLDALLEPQKFDCREAARDLFRRTAFGNVGLSVHGISAAPCPHKGWERAALPATLSRCRGRWWRSWCRGRPMR